MQIKKKFSRWVQNKVEHGGLSLSDSKNLMIVYKDKALITWYC